MTGDDEYIEELITAVIKEAPALIKTISATTEIYRRALSKGYKDVCGVKLQLAVKKRVNEYYQTNFPEHLVKRIEGSIMTDQMNDAHQLYEDDVQKQQEHLKRLIGFMPVGMVIYTIAWNYTYRGPVTIIRDNNLEEVVYKFTYSEGKETYFSLDCIESRLQISKLVGKLMDKEMRNTSQEDKIFLHNHHRYLFIESIKIKQE